MKFTIKEDGRRLLIIVAAALLMAINIKTFVRTGGLFPGGVTGLTLLIQEAVVKFLHVEIPYSIINISLNAIPAYIGWRYVGKKFTLYSIVMIMVNSLFTDVFPPHIITYDTLLISIFGGIINGTVVSLCLLAGATSGGTDFISIYYSQKHGIEIWNYILLFNVGILSIAGLLFGWDKALYSIIFQYVSTQTIHLLYRNYQQQSLFIITEYPQEIADVIFEKTHHGSTIFDCVGSHEHKNTFMVYSVISSEDAKKAITAIKTIDPAAFINSIHTTELVGHFYLKPRD